MKINILTIFPKLIEAFTDNTIFKRAIEKNLIELNVFDIRDFSTNKHKKVDDYPFGGGPGMVLSTEPFFNFFNKHKVQNVIYTSPQGVILNNKLSKELAMKDEITILCGHYEGIDERVIEKHVDLEISLGNYVLSGGELPSLVILDSILRFIPEFINENSVDKDSFENNLLDHSVYTRPATIEEISVPTILLSGNHSLIEEYQARDSFYRTIFKRPDLLKSLSDQDKKKIKKILKEIEGYLI